MKFKINREKILPDLQKVCSVVEKNQALPILQNLLIKAENKKIILTATDSEVEIVAILDHEIEIEGKVTTSARKLLDICRALQNDADIEFNFNKGKIYIKSNKSRFNLATLPAEDFPATDELEEACEFSLSHVGFRNMLVGTMFSMAQQDVRYYLNGLLLELGKDDIRAVATDGHRLAMKEIKAEVKGEKKIIIPRKGVIELVRLLDSDDGDVHVKVGSNNIHILINNIQITSRLIDGSFPDYEKVLPEPSENIAKIDRELMKQALRRAAILSNDKYKGVRILLKNNLLTAFAHNLEQEEAEEEITIEYSGDEIEIGFNVNYIIEILSCISTDKFVLSLSDSNSSCLILPDGETSSKYVVMPMKL